jgi:SAM-dependent methyltransferase
LAYFDSAFSLPTGYRFLLRQAISFLGGLNSYATVPRPVLLDIGCGEKPYRKLLNRYKYIGLDAFESVSSPEVLGAISAIPFASGKLDACLTVWVLDDLPEPEAAIREIARVLRPGGHYFAVECQSTASHFLPHDYFRFAPNALIRMARDNGLEAVSRNSYGGDFALVGFSLIRIVRRVCSRLGLPGRVLAAFLVFALNAVFAPLDSLARLSVFRGEFEANSLGHCYVFRKAEK